MSFDPSASEPLPNSIGAYRIESLLGRGGMGEVFLAWDARLQRHVAIKRIRGDKAPDDEARSRFRREARAAAKLRHPAIVQVHDILETEEGDCIVMEFVEGLGLRDLIDSGELDERRSLEIARQVSEGLAEAHDHGLVHRDLKAENVRLDRQGQAKILDFGLVRVVRSDAGGANPETADVMTETGAILGTVYAMSPEQASGRPVDHRSDLFSLGVLLYYMLSGRVPFRGDNQLITLHRLCNEPPPPLADLRPELSKDVVAFVEKLLAKDPAMRPRDAHEAARFLAGDAAESSPASAEAEPISFELKRPPPPELPAEPYPLLLPYTHPQLFAGRERELTELLRMLSEPTPIVVLSSASGTGKSSLLLGGAMPKLRASGRPTATTRFPHEPRLARRLLTDLLIGEDREEGPAIFAERLEETGRLAGRAPVLLLDQFEEVLRTERARSQAGLLLAASMRRAPGDGPLCYWVLAVRKEWLGELLEWMRDVLKEARSTGTDVKDLPYDLSGSERMRHLLLPPLAAVRSGPKALDAATEVLQEAIERPLQLRDENDEPRYRYSFAPGRAARLARAFAKTRLARPAAPLGPELQVVLAHLLTRSPDGVIEVPEEPERLIGSALEDHLRRSLDQAFPETDRVGRARAILALRELVAAEGGRGEGLPAETLIAAIGPSGAEVLEKISSPIARLVVATEAPEGLLYVLSHDRLAEIVSQIVEEEGREGELLIDRELLAARRVVALKSTLFADDEGRVSTRLSGRLFRRVEEHGEALLCDEQRRAWWRACVRRRSKDRARWMSRSALVLLLLFSAAFLIGRAVEERAERRRLTDQVVQGEASAATAAFARLRDEGMSDEESSLLLLERERPSVILEEGLGGLNDEERSRVVLDILELLLPRAEENPQDLFLITNLVRALDFAPMRDPSFAEAARELRDRALKPLRESRLPPSSPAAEDPDWIEIPAGDFTMGTADDQEGKADERPQRRVSVSAFRLQRHEVTNAEFRRFVPDHGKGKDPELPAAQVSWYAAYAYAAWLGGRLPTEAEWEYAARAGCRFAYCDREGREIEVDAAAWTLRNAMDENGRLAPHPIRRLEPNPWGLYDMLGNLWEWTGDWYGPYDSNEVIDPWGAIGPPAGGGVRVNRGGSFRNQVDRTRFAYRNKIAPGAENENQGFRVRLPSLQTQVEQGNQTLKP